jgi:predicted amidohydrolase
MKLALCQVDVAFGDVARNLATVRERTLAAAAQGAQLVAFPECGLTGYAFADAAAARAAAIALDGPELRQLAGLCRATGAWLVVGFVETASPPGGAGGRARGEADGPLYNAAALLGPDGVALHYRKLHLPFLGCDRFMAPGDRPLAVATTPLGRIGLSICYDGSFPESARVLKLAGAQLIVLPTNWPEAATISRQHQSIVRAFENHVHYAACNRVGSEGGFRFPGESSIVDFTGRVVARAGDSATTLFAELDLPAADLNRVVNVPGQYELDRIAHRRPEHYGAIVAPLRPSQDPR